MKNLNEELYNEECYPGMTVKDAERMDNLNSKNHYGLSHEELNKLIKQHKKARSQNDKRKISMIEYRLTDINFHSECGLLVNGKYDEALALEW